MSERVRQEAEGALASGSIDQNQIARAVLRRKLFILGSTALAFLAGLAFVTLVKPRYTADAKVLVENQENYFTRPDKSNVADGGVLPDSEAVQSQVQLVQSRDLARRAVRELNLVNNREFDPMADGGGSLGRVLVMLGLQRNPAAASAEDRVLDAYFEHLTVLSPPKTRIVSIEFSSSDPQLAARGANAIADIYLDTQSKAKRDSARQIAASLSSEIADLRGKLAESEARAESFRLKSGLLVGANNLTITAQQLGDVNSQLTLARGQQADAQAKAKLIRDMVRQGRIGDVPDVANNELMRSLSAQRVALKAQLARDSRTLLSGHPQIKELTAQIADLDTEIRVAAEKTVRTLENDARIAGGRVDNLKATLEAQKRIAGAANSDDVTLRSYESEARLLKEQLEASTAKYQEALARQAAASTPADARIVSRAIEPSQPSFPKKAPILTAATLAGLVFSLGAVVAGELLSGRAALPLADAPPLPDPAPAGRPGARIFARLRRARGSAPVPVDSPAFETAPAYVPDAPAVTPPPPSPPPFEPAHALPAFADVETELAERIAGAGASGQAIVTLVAGLDHSRTQALAAKAIALSRALARGGRAILANLDADSVALDRLAGAPNAPGLCDLLSGECSFAEAIHRDGLTRLHVLPHGGARNIDGQDGLDLILDALCETYDHLVLVVPAIEVSNLASTLAPYADFVVLSAPSGAQDLAARAAYDELRKAGAGDVLVLIDAPSAPHGSVNAA